MIEIKLYSQRDATWGNDQHGTSSTKLKDTGCTITVLTVLLNQTGYDETPKTTNQKLTSNSGYSSGNLLNWSVVPKIWPKLSWVGRYYSFDNSKALEWLKNGLIPMIEVSATPIGGTGKHWLGAVGDGKVFDPWTGTITDFSKWTPTGMALYTYKVENNSNGSESQESNMTDQDLFTKYGVKTLEELDAKINEACGTTWGSETQSGGGFLGDARREITQLKIDVAAAQQNQTTNIAESLSNIAGKDWEINGLSVVSGDMTANYKIKS
jgi:hypothetical protein